MIKTVMIVLLVALQMCTNKHTQLNDNKNMTNKINTEKLDVATFGAGCFWCIETIFQRIEGVEKVISGYSGGNTKQPTYDEVCSGETGHAEVCQVYFDPQKVSYEMLLKVFWKIHDPTTLNRQGADVGTQYRSVVFYHTDKQKQLAQNYKEKLDSAGIWKNQIVTEITAFDTFYRAEAYHQDYYNNNKAQPYCNLVITPKVEKFEEVFSDILK